MTRFCDHAGRTTTQRSYGWLGWALTHLSRLSLSMKKTRLLTAVRSSSALRSSSSAYASAAALSAGLVRPSAISRTRLATARRSSIKSGIKMPSERAAWIRTLKAAIVSARWSCGPAGNNAGPHWSRTDGSTVRVGEVNVNSTTKFNHLTHDWRGAATKGPAHRDRHSILAPGEIGDEPISGWAA